MLRGLELLSEPAPRRNQVLRPKPERQPGQRRARNWLASHNPDARKPVACLPGLELRHAPEPEYLDVPVLLFVQAAQELAREASRVLELPNGRVDPHLQARDQGRQADLVATPWNSSVNPSAAMAAPPAAVHAPEAPDRVHPRVPVLHPGQACPVGCASPLLLESSCSSRSRLDVPQRRHPDVLSLEASPARGQRRHHRSLGRRHRQLLAAPTERVLGLQVSDVPAGPTGTTAPNSRHCAAVRPRNSARKSTSSERTMTR